MAKKKSVPEASTYHPELISIYLSGVPIAVIFGNTFVPLIFIYTLQEYVPHSFLMFFFMYAVSISILRVILAKVLKKANYNNINRDKYISYTIYLIALNGTIWGIVNVLTYLYAPSEYLFFSTALTLGMVSASITSLTPIFKAFLSYVMSGVVPLTLVFFLVGEITYTAFAFLSIVFTGFIIIIGNKQYKKLYDVIILKDQLKLLNNDLEGEVKLRTQELEALNSSLEEKIAQEIAKNREKDKQMVEHSRMAQMGEMISMIAHQWRQPLGAIASTSIDIRMNLMLESYDLNDKEQQKECVSYFDSQLVKVEGYVQDLTQTIDDFRNFYKPNKKQKVCSINDPLQKSLAIIQATVDAEGTKIIKDFGSKEKLTLFDSELMQVFLNILKNAQDHFKEQKIQSSKIIIITRDIEHGVKVEICDNGGGIPEDIVEKIFDPYFSTKSEKNGTGLGLYMSKTIVEEHHNGSLSVENRDGGACFTIKILT